MWLRLEDGSHLNLSHVVHVECNYHQVRYLTTIVQPQKIHDEEGEPVHVMVPKILQEHFVSHDLAKARFTKVSALLMDDSPRRVVRRGA